MQIAYLDGSRLRRSLLAACEYAQGLRQELNRINVFPVPDGDTGTNLALTTRAIADALSEPSEALGVGDVAMRAAEASVLGARGNCGMMLSHFLLGFAETLEGRSRVSTGEFASALSAGVDHLQNALDEPQEGTMLTVMRDTAAAAERELSPDFKPLIDRLVDTARVSLAHTPDLLPVLRAAGVVDAGAKGFVALLEGVVHLIDGDPLVARSEPFEPGEGLAAAFADFNVEETYRYCTEALVRGPDLPASPEVRARLHDWGDSLIVIRTGDVLKAHIHTDEPEQVFSYLRTLGRLATHKAEDMKAQHATVGRAADRHQTLARRPVTVVTDSAADLPDEVFRAHGIHVVPLTLQVGEETLRDRIDVTADEFAERLGSGGPLPTTSQPSPGAFLEAYRRAAEEGESLVVVALGSTLSGTFASAEAAAARMSEAPVHVFDSLAVSTLQGLLALKAAELAELAVPAPEIVRQLGVIRQRSGELFTVDSFDRLLASGRVSKGRAWLGGMLGVKPILGVSTTGVVEPVGTALGRDRLVGRALDAVEQRIPANAGRLRFGLSHVRAADRLDAVAAGIRARFGDVEILSTTATPVVATHVGAGAWCVSWIVED